MLLRKLFVFVCFRVFMCVVSFCLFFSERLTLTKKHATTRRQFNLSRVSRSGEKKSRRFLYVKTVGKIISRAPIRTLFFILSHRKKFFRSSLERKQQLKTTSSITPEQERTQYFQHFGLVGLGLVGLKKRVTQEPRQQRTETRPSKL